MIKLASTSLVAVALGLGLALAAGSAFAGVKSPPKDRAECSPGYWKNHPEVWVDICCNDTDNPTCDALSSSLEAKGPGSGAIRESAAEFLDACFGTGDLTPCTED
ncbi:MAG: hypothetical protein ACREUD_08015 [Gammaproteobacteria bacterium]